MGSGVNPTGDNRVVITRGLIMTLVTQPSKIDGFAGKHRSFIMIFSFYYTI